MIPCNFERTITIPGWLTCGISIKCCRPTVFKWWDPNNEGLCVWGAWGAVGAASIAASKLDLTGNGNHLTGVSDPNWNTTDGWIFNGTNQYFETNFLPETNQTQTMLVQFTNATNLGVFIGASGTGGRGWLIARFANAYYGNGANVMGTAGALSFGNYAVMGARGYRNAIADSAVIGPWTGPSSVTTWIGDLNGGGLPIAAYIRAVVIYDCILTYTQLFNVTNEMAAL